MVNTDSSNGSAKPTRSQIERAVALAVTKVKQVKPCREEMANENVYEISLSEPKREVIFKHIRDTVWQHAETEVHALKLLHSRGARVPELIYHDLSSAEFPFKYLILEKMNGDNLRKLLSELSPLDIVTIACETAREIAKIHSVESAYFGALVEGEFGEHRNLISLSEKLLRSYQERGRKEGLFEEQFCSKLWRHFEVNSHLLEAVDSATLIHHDLTANNILVERSGGSQYKITLIDLGRACWRCPEWEMGVMDNRWMAGYEKSAQRQKQYLLFSRAFRETYEEISGRKLCQPLIQFCDLLECVKRILEGSAYSRSIRSRLGALLDGYPTNPR